MSMKNKVRVLVRKDGLINLYINHPSYLYSPSYKDSRNSNKDFINHLRKQFPEVRNEFRDVPVRWYEDGSYGWCDRHFCAYGLTKSQYVMLKLSWTYKEVKVHSRTRKGLPPKTSVDTYFDPTFFGKPTGDCEKRFSKPGFKQKPLRIT
jgi:hypothetical protein